MLPETVERLSTVPNIIGIKEATGDLQRAREVLDRVQGLGEVFSAQLLGTHLRALGEDCAVLDARDVLVVGHGELGVDVDWESSADRLANTGKRAVGKQLEFELVRGDDIRQRHRLVAQKIRHLVEGRVQRLPQGLVRADLGQRLTHAGHPGVTGCRVDGKGLVATT